MSVARRLAIVHRELESCRRCPGMIGPVVHGPAIDTRIMLVGQAPGPREGSFGRPFAWTAGKTLFRWFEETIGADEETVRAKIYMAAVARCFPGKARGGGDRRPDVDEVDACRAWLEREVAILSPRLVLAVGSLAIEQVLGHRGQLADVVGAVRHVRWLGTDVDVIALPHPSGASTWHKSEQGKRLLRRALRAVARHPEIVAAFGTGGARRRSSGARRLTATPERRARTSVASG